METCGNEWDAVDGVPHGANTEHLLSSTLEDKDDYFRIFQVILTGKLELPGEGKLLG